MTLTKALLSEALEKIKFGFLSSKKIDHFFPAKSPKMSGEISKDAFVIYLFVYMLCLLTVFNYLSDFHSGGPLWVFNIFGENILDYSPSICFKTSVKLLHSHLYLSWMINSRLSILESTSFCSFLRNNFMLYLSYSWNDLFSASGI